MNSKQILIKNGEQDKQLQQEQDDTLAEYVKAHVLVDSCKALFLLNVESKGKYSFDLIALD